MSDLELRRLLRTRDLEPEDPVLARRVAIHAARNGDRSFAVEAWQEVLRRAPGDHEAEQRLGELGCDLVWRGRDVGGNDELENLVDGAILVRCPVLGGAFVSKRPVVYGEFQRFLSRHDFKESRRWLAHGGPLRFVGGAWSLRNELASYVLEASWLGARAYAAWAGGRLCAAEEWEQLADTGAPLEGLDQTEGEWVDGENAAGLRPTKCLWDPRWPKAEGSHTAWWPEDAWPSVLFRYVRDSWFRG